MPTISSLTVAPVKALAVVPREAVRLEGDGVPDDRRLFLLDRDGAVVTQRRLPGLAAVVPDLDLAAGKLSVRFPDGSLATSELVPEGDVVHARLFGKDRAGHVVPGVVAEALSEHAGEPLRLVLADTVGVGWDEGPVSIVGQASLAAVGAPQAEDGRRFRMLVELAATAPYEEDAWLGRRVRLGDTVVRVTHSLGRCVVIEHSPVTGAKDWKGLRALAEHRGPHSLTLGVIAAVETPGTLRVGDEVGVVSED